MKIIKHGDCMRKTIIFISIIILILILGGVLIINALFPKVNVSNEKATLNYSYNEKNISVELNKDESELLRKIFNGKRLYSDNLSCEFTENISIRFDDLIFCVACDSCPIVKFDNKYFKISEIELQELHNIFKSRGCTFPCV